MNHQPYERWILMDEQLAGSQKRSLREHLDRCPQCRETHRAHTGLSHLFRSSPTPMPEEGFTARWQARIKQRESTKRLRIVGITLAIIIASVLLLLSSIGAQLPSLLDQLPQLVFQTTTRALTWLVFIDQIASIFEPAFRVGVKMIPPAWYVTFGIGISMVFMAWLYTISESLAFVRRATDE